MEKTNMARFQEVMRTMQNSASGVSGFQQSSPQFIPVPIPQSQPKESEPDVVEELMKKMIDGGGCGVREGYGKTI